MKTRRTSRRSLLQALFIPVFSSSASVKASTKTSSCTALITYFTRSGNTRVIAEQLHRDLKADLFFIEPAKPYPADYLETVEQARLERDQGLEPALKKRVENLNQYEKIFLGFPIWGETAPPIIRSFLSNHDLSGKTLIPFITHGKYGLGNSLDVVRRHTTANVLAGFSMQADQERDTMESVNDWLIRDNLTTNCM